MRTLALPCTALLIASALGAQVPRAVIADPPRDSLHPARMMVLHIPSGGVNINGVAYLPSGTGQHPVFILMHGLPGNEKNLDLAQAVRRAGWAAITFNFRGSWGSQGNFRFANNLDDAESVLAYLRDSANARRMGLDTKHIVLAGHSMGGWVTVLTAAHHPELDGAVLISAADMSRSTPGNRDRLVRSMAGNMESLAGVTAEQMADEVIAAGPRWSFDSAAAGLAKLPLLVLTSNDGLAAGADSLVKHVRAFGDKRVTTLHEATDHPWSDKRIALESAVIRWLQPLIPKQ